MANVNDLRTDLARRLRQQLGGDFVVVAAPDHPLVMRSVDVLVGGKSGLTAFVTPSAEERRQPALLGARVTLNKVALPPETQFVYVARADDDAPLLPIRFVEQLSFADRSVTRSAVAIVERSSQAPRSPYGDKARQRSQSRFAATYRLARLVNSERARTDTDRPQRSRGAKLSFDTVKSIPSAFTDQPLSTRSIIGLSARGADRWFAPTDDQPVPTNETAGLVFSPDFPHLRHDPQKVLRAAAFAGWILTPTSSGRSLEQVAEMALRFTRLQ